MTSENNEYFRVSKCKSSNGKKYFWRYCLIKNSKRIYLRSETLPDLEKKVKNLMLPWGPKKESKKLQVSEAHFTEIYQMLKNQMRPNNTGFRRVSINKNGYCIYRITINGKRHAIGAKNIDLLKKRVEEKGYPWELVDQNV